VAREAEKKAIETARYVIPVAAFTSMVHTVSGIVLHRLWRMMRTADTPTESAAVVAAMVAQVRGLDPESSDGGGAGPLDEDEVVEARLPRAQENGDDEAARIDRRLAERTSLLVDYMPGAEPTTADAVRTLLGASPETLDDDAALALVL